MKMCYNKLFLQRVLFISWPQLLICKKTKKNIFYAEFSIFMWGLTTETSLWNNYFYTLIAILVFFFFIFVNSKRIDYDFFLIKLLHLRIYF